MTKTPDPKAPEVPKEETGRAEAPTAAPSPKTKATPKVPTITVRSVPESFCRAERRWTREAQTVPTSDFTQDQLDALRAENNLVVVDSELEA